MSCANIAVYGGVKSDTQSVASRQQAINASYDKLVQTAEVMRGVMCVHTCMSMYVC